MLLISLPLGERDERAQATMGGGLRKRRSGLRGQLTERGRWMPQPQLGDLDEVLRQFVEVERANRLELDVRGAGGAHEVRLVRVDEPVCARAGRCDDGVLFQAKHDVACTGQGEQVVDRLVAFRVGDGVTAALGQRQRQCLRAPQPRR